MSDILARRRFLKGIGASSLLLGTAGCSAVKDDASAKSKPHYMMVFDQNKCTGCGDCKTACNQINQLPEGVSKVLLERKAGHEAGKACPQCGKTTDCGCTRKYVRVSCQQCQSAPCVSVCPTGAAHKDPATGIVTMKDGKCAGCKYCLAACPYNARFINDNTDVADNCDFCLEAKLSKGELPACVEACRYDALVFGDVNDPTAFISRLLAVKDSVRIKAHLGTEPSLRYIPIVKVGI